MDAEEDLGSCTFSKSGARLKDNYSFSAKSTASGRSSSMAGVSTIFRQNTFFSFERKGFGRGGLISSFLEELGTHFYVAF